MKKIVIIGGGTAGWLTALYIQKNIPYSQVTVIASSELGILGAGEGTTPDFIEFLKEVDIDPIDLIKNTKATIKKSIKFVNWNSDKSFWQIFTSKFSYESIEKLCNEGKVNYNQNLEKTDVDALHVDANLLASYFQSVSLSRGVRLINSKVIEIFDDEDKFITGVRFEDGHEEHCDFIFDCSGLKRLIIGKHYNINFKSYGHMLPMKKAMPFFVDNSNEENLPPYTESIAMKYGWMWKIPVQGRYGCGYVYDSDYVDDAAIKQEIEDYLGHEIVVPRTFQFEAGCFENTWINNCVAIGLSTGFIEPLEATSIWMQIMSLRLLKQYAKGIFLRHSKSIDSYNSKINSLNFYTLNFIYFHYLTDRNDTPFWEEFRKKNQPTQTILEIIKLCHDNEIDYEAVTKLFFEIQIDEFDQNITMKNWISAWQVIGRSNGLITNDVDVNSTGYDETIDHATQMKHIDYIKNVA